jgi:pimeloyl-ACP methyl ester carboxylesterase
VSGAARVFSLLLIGFFMVSADHPASAATPCADIDQGRCHAKLSTGIDMAYVETGPENGPAVILIHGVTDNIRSWSTAMRALHKLNPGLHILAIDLRGHGASSMPAGPGCRAAPEICFQMSQFADDVIAFMAAKQIAKATLAGHSLGSFVAQDIALRRPELVSRAILLATSTTCVGNAALRDFVLKEPVEGSWKAALEAKGKRYPDDFYDLTPLDADPEAMAWMAQNWVVDPIADPEFLKPYLPETAHVKLGAWIGATRALLATDNTERLKRLKVPTLVLWATQDNIFLVADQVAIKAALAEAHKATGAAMFWKQYGLLPLPASGAQESDIGHNIQWGAPDAVAADIETFIKSGAPLPVLTHAAPAPNVTQLQFELGRAGVVERL